MRDRVPMPPGHWRGPGPFEAPGPRGYGGVAHALFPWLFLLLFAALVTVAIIALVRFTRGAPGRGTREAPTASPTPMPSDQALQDLRLRYARGEIDRNEYLEKSADLGDTRPAPPPSTQ